MAGLSSKARFVVAVVIVCGLQTKPDAAAESDTLPPAVPPPEFLENKAPLPDLLLKDKKPDSYFTGFPAIGWNPETMFTYGVAVQWFDNGDTNSPFFRYAPYRRQIPVTFTGSTGGSTRALIGYDEPYVNDTPWRLRALAIYDRNRFENYFGLGEATLGPLRYPGSTHSFDSFDDYQEALQKNVEGNTWARFNEYDKTRAGGVVTLERNLWGGWLRPQLGLQVSHIDIRDYSGDKIDGAVMQPTRLLLDDEAGKIIGFDGGWDNAVKVGLTFDSRDFEPDPSSGMMLQAVTRISTKGIGSSFNYEQVTFSGRGFHNLLEDGRLILAGKVTYVMQFGDVPFYSAPIIPFTEGDVDGLGGHPTLRGYVADRFVGDASMYANGELRWSFAETTIKRQHLRFMAVPFVDTGRVFDSVGQTTLNDWKIDGGIGLRLAWNIATIVSIDFARSSEGNLIHMQLGHQF
jgi:outer membrane protein assembly factor BamA